MLVTYWRRIASRAGCVLIVAASHGLSGCTSAAMQSEKKEKDLSLAHVLTRQDDGRSVAVHPGDTISISLPENPSTGYRWTLDQSDESVLAAIGSRYVHGPADRVGRGGEHVWTFTARQEGTARLSFVLRRAWETGASATDRFGITVLSCR
jgi:inhibitor of cysteine peptidase